MQPCGRSMAFVRVRPMSLARFSVQARILQRRCGRLSMARTLQLLTSGGVTGGTPTGSGCGTSGEVGGDTGAEFGSTGVGSG